MNEWPSEFWRTGAFLMNQQCWQFGRDIESIHGNLLTAAGFKRTRPPADVQASSRYLRERPGEPMLCFWAFGVLAFLPDEGGIYVNRYNFVPRWVPDPEGALESWRASFFDGCGTALTRRQIRCTRGLLRFVIASLAAYEDWVTSEFGVAYRRDTLRDWHQPTILPGRMAIEWRRLSWHVPEPPPVMPDRPAGWPDTAKTALHV